MLKGLPHFSSLEELGRERAIPRYTKSVFLVQFKLDPIERKDVCGTAAVALDIGPLA